MTPSSSDALFWAAVALCAVAQLALLHSFFLGASRPARGVAASFRATETLWAVVPAAVLVVLLVATWQQLNRPPELRFELDRGAAVSAPAPVIGAAAPRAGSGS